MDGDSPTVPTTGCQVPVSEEDAIPILSQARLDELNLELLMQK